MRLGMVPQSAAEREALVSGKVPVPFFKGATVMQDSPAGSADEAYARGAEVFTIRPTGRPGYSEVVPAARRKASVKTSQTVSMSGRFIPGRLVAAGRSSM